MNQDLQKVLSEHFVMLESINPRRKIYKMDTWVTGYENMMHVVADLVKVSMLALEGIDNCDSDRIPEPGTNIAGVLALILDMLPYEEAQLLDALHEKYIAFENDDKQNASTAQTEEGNSIGSESYPDYNYSTITIHPATAN